MDSVIRTIAIYLVLLVLFRIAGQRSIAQITTFDFVLLLVIGEAVQNALVGEDASLTNALIIVATFIGLDILMSWLKESVPRVEKVIDGTPLIILEDGKLMQERMLKERIDAADILTAARAAHGLERLEQIKYAILERSGGISIVPKSRH
jgi:uncharacterized membrane protein YcaP (DUF421 family)